MPEDPNERRRREVDDARARQVAREQEIARDRAHWQRSRCTTCGLVLATLGSHCQVCSPRADRETEPLRVPEPWPREDRLDDDLRLERDRLHVGVEQQHYRRTRCITCGLMSAVFGPYCSICLPPDLRGDDPEHLLHLEQAFVDGMPVEKHHVFPKAFREQFAGKVDIHAHTVPLPQAWHRELNRSWHLEWTWFFEHHQDPSQAEIEEQAASMMEDHGFLQALFVEYSTPMYEPRGAEPEASG